MAINLKPSDRNLMEQISQQDQAALETLYERYARLVKGLASRFLNSPEEAEEVVLDVFAQIWRKAATYDSSKSRVDTWIFLITRSRSIDRLRALSRAAQVVNLGENLLSPAPLTPEDNLFLTERCEQVQKAIAQLPPEQRQVLESAYFQGLSHAEIAAQLGLPLGTIKTRLRLGLQKLRQGLSYLQS